MSNSEFKHLNINKIRKRINILNALAYISWIVAIASYVVFFVTDYKLNWSWLLIGATYTLFPINFKMQVRRLRTELASRKEQSENQPHQN